jgi:hypothetical protein
MSYKRKLAVVAVIELTLICVLALSLMGCSASVGRYGIDVNVHNGR